MPANYPGIVANIPTRVDGPTNKIFADHINVLGDEIEAIENALLSGLQHSLAIAGPRPWVDVLAKGAKGDGSTDDAAAIQAAVDAVPSTGGIVLFPEPASAYILGSSITVKSNVGFLGMGQGTIIRQKSNANITHLFNAELLSPSDVVFESLFIDGNTALQSAGTSLIVIGGTATRIAIRRCRLENAKGYGIFVTGSATRVRIEDNDFGGTLSDRAINISYAAATSGRHIIAFNRIGKTSGFGIALVLADESLIVGNEIRGDGTGANNEPINLDRSSRNRVIGNDCSRSGDSGIVLHTSGQASPQCAQNIIALNTCERNAKWGIALNEASAYNLVIGNICRNNIQSSVAAGQDAQIKIDSTSASFPAVFNQINGNIVLDDQGTPTATRGILVVNTNCHDTHIGFNTIKGATFPIADAGLRTVWVDLQTGNLAFVVSALMVSSSGSPIRNILQANVTYDPPSLADGAVAATTVTVTGANPGDVAYASHAQIGVQNVQVSAHVQAANTVRVVLRNVSGGVLDIASGTLRTVVMVI